MSGAIIRKRKREGKGERITHLFLLFLTAGRLKS